MMDGRAGLLGARRDLVSRRTVLAGDGRASRHRHRSCPLVLMLLMLVGLPGQFLLLVLEPLLTS